MLFLEPETWIGVACSAVRTTGKLHTSPIRAEASSRTTGAQLGDGPLGVETTQIIGKHDSLLVASAARALRICMICRLMHRKSAATTKRQTAATRTIYTDSSSPTHILHQSLLSPNAESYGYISSSPNTTKASIRI
jgi:hypothetical protein